MKLPFTDKFLAALRSKDGKEVNHTDADTKGLAFRVTAEQRKTFRFSYTYRPKNERRLLVWEYPAVTLKTARERVAAIRTAIADGKDPKDEQSVEPDKTVAQIVDLYLASVRKLASAYNITQSLKSHVVPKVGTVLAKDFGLLDLDKVIAPILARDAGVQANVVQANLKRVFRYAASKGIKINRDWLFDARRPTKTESRDVSLERDEIVVVWNWLKSDALKAKLVREILMLLLITGQRIGEVTGMRRNEIDLENRVWTIPKERMKNRRKHLVPLSPMALTIIQKRLEETKGAFLFPNESGKGPVAITSVDRAVDRARKRGIFGEMKHWTPHDFRRTLTSHLEIPREFGVPLEVREAILSHVKRGLVGTYNVYQYSDEKREALDKWSDFLSRLVGENVLQLPVKAA